MDREIDILMEKGIAAAEARNKEKAEELLNQVVALDPGNEQAWLWLSAVVEGIDAQRECLHRVLEINPANPFARTGLSFVNHLRVGYEYLAARAPWMGGVEEGRATLAELPSRRCPRCKAVNPGWAYLCNQCAAILESIDVAEMVKREIRDTDTTTSLLLRPWAGAAILDAVRAFAPEVALASPMRAVLAVSLGAVALNLLRGVGTLGLIALTTTGRSSRLPEGLTMAFVSDQLALLAGGLLAWVLLSAVTHAVARSQGGLGSPRVHYYLVAVAVSAWMPIAGVTGLLWWTAAMLLPGASTPLVASLACGLLFLYLATLATQAVHTAHDQEALQETATTGAFLLACVVIYAGLTALSPPVLRSPMLKAVEVILLPLWP